MLRLLYYRYSTRSLNVDFMWYVTFCLSTYKYITAKNLGLNLVASVATFSVRDLPPAFCHVIFLSANKVWICPTQHAYSVIDIHEYCNLIPTTHEDICLTINFIKWILHPDASASSNNECYYTLIGKFCTRAVVRDPLVCKSQNCNSQHRLRLFTV